MCIDVFGSVQMVHSGVYGVIHRVCSGVQGVYRCAQMCKVYTGVYRCVQLYKVCTGWLRFAHVEADDMKGDKVYICIHNNKYLRTFGQGEDHYVRPQPPPKGISASVHMY